MELSGTRARPRNLLISSQSEQFLLLDRTRSLYKTKYDSLKVGYILSKLLGHAQKSTVSGKDDRFTLFLGVFVQFAKNREIAG